MTQLEICKLVSQINGGFISKPVIQITEGRNSHLWNCKKDLVIAKLQDSSIFLLLLISLSLLVTGHEI